MNIKLKHGHKLVAARPTGVTIVTTHNQSVVLTHTDVVQLLKAMNEASTKAAIAAAQDRRD